MPQITGCLAQSEMRVLLDTAVSLFDGPAAIVADGDEVLACNEQWRCLTRCTCDTDERPSLERSLREFSRVNVLAEQLKGGPQDAGTVKTRRDAPGPLPGEARADYQVHWRQLRPPSQGGALAIVSLRPVREAEPPAPVMDLQQARIDRLLVRQTLIEESERLRLGRALHDVVVQDLAQVRAAVRASASAAHESAAIIASIDRIINEVRTLTFDLGPPLLEDLGMRPALQWLAEHLKDRYSASISMVDDGSDPRLSKPTQTIIFRATRELAINAAKHAPGAEIVISCVTNHRSVRISVRDTGPGFDTARVRHAGDDTNHYGLLSVEQQIRGVGGAFDIVSEIGEGTRATITAPMEQDHGERNA
jgi:signal transduction histidine kinase